MTSTGSLFCGLISGTSMDGVDAVLVDFSASLPRVCGTLCLPYPDDLRRRLQDVVDDPALAPMRAIARLDIAVAHHLADAVDTLIAQQDIDKARITAIGSHGQNLYHGPDDDPPVTVQVGDPNTLAERTGVTVVADFRRRDMAAGGQGAPLAPALHNALFRSAEEDRAVVNIGGIANITLLPADAKAAVTGYDIGPGNCLLDDWHNRHREKPYDRAGAWAKSGEARASLVHSMRADGYFSQPAPKSTGRELFNLDWLSRFDSGATELADVQASLAELTATTIADAVQATRAKRVLICGGGVHNDYLIERIKIHLPHRTVEPTTPYGLDPDWVEAVLFAWLARQTLERRPGNIPSVSGASGERILGGVYHA